MRQSLVCTTLLVAAAYLALATAPMACALDVPDRHTAGHHHGGNPPHSSFCAWACQANPASDLVLTGSPLGPVFAAIVFPLKHGTVAPHRFDHFSVSRGPPPAFHLS